MIYVHSTSPPPPTTSLIPMAECVSRFGVCAETLRRWDKSGKITSYRVNIRSHRRFLPSEISQAMGIEIKSGKNEGAIPVVYARTSSESQKESLVNQVKRMREEVSKLEDIPTSQVKVYQDNASAYGDRPQLNLLVEDVVAQPCKISKIYVLWEDRLSRSPCLTRLLESICKNRGIEIVIIESECLLGQRHFA